MNILVLIMFGILLLFACTMSIGFSVTQVKQDDWYLEWTGQWPDPYGVRARTHTHTHTQFSL